MKERVIVEEKFWVERQGPLSVVGLTKEACASFDHVEWLQLPSVGEKLQRGSPAVIIESSKAAIDVESPISGVVKDVNKELLSSPQTLENFPETTWLFAVESITED